MSIARELSRGLRTLERAQENPTFKWQGNDYPCVRGARIDADQLTVGGFAPQAAVTLLVRPAVLPGSPETKPAKGDEIIFEGYTYVLDEIHENAGVLKYLLKDPNRGA